MNSIKTLSGVGTAELIKQKAKVEAPGGAQFAEQLKAAIGEMNEIQEQKETAVADIATGQVKDLHQAAIAIGKAELNMKLMLEIRNKALSAYKELGRTQL